MLITRLKRCAPCIPRRDAGVVLRSLAIVRDAVAAKQA